MSGGSSYWVIEATLRPESEELWSLLCHERGSTGAEQVSDDGTVRVLRHSFPTAPDIDMLLAAFARSYPEAPPPVAVNLQEHAVEPWETAWQSHFTPLRIGQRLLVTPPWAPAEAQDAGRLRIVIEPGQGFGTGWHPTTALALQALEAAVAGSPPVSMVDVGTGSGILAIAACLLGTRSAVTLDVDAQALPEVRRNFTLSRLQPPSPVQGRPDCLRGTFPLVVANIVSEVLLAEREHLAGLTAPGGCLILSGILERERTALLDAYAEPAFLPVHENSQEGWISVTFRRGETNPT